jgi:hypothetical protein
VEATTSTSTGTNISGKKLISSRRVLEYFILASAGRVSLVSLLNDPVRTGSFIHSPPTIRSRENKELLFLPPGGKKGV